MICLINVGNLECKDGWSKFRNKCYLEVGNNPSISITWTDARTKCLEQQGDLASVPDRETLEFLNKLGGIRVSHWLGGRKKDGRWTWTDGTPWSNEFWMPGEPNNEGETIDGIKRNQTAINLWKTGQWDDKASEYLNSGYFCQTARNFKTTGTSVIDYLAVNFHIGFVL